MNIEKIGLIVFVIICLYGVYVQLRDAKEFDDDEMEM